MQYATKSTDQCLNARDADHVASGAPSRTEHLAHARRFWLIEARRSLRFARQWAAKFGGPLHAYALATYLQYLADAELYRSWAREPGGAT